MAYNDSDAASIQTSVLSMRSVPSMETITPTDTAHADLPPPYSAHDPMASSQPSSSDPRAASTQSLVARDSNLGVADGADGKRKLLLIYIHGFMGNETSFRSFPAHVHNLLTVFLGSSHVIHTKVYPRYRSKSSIEVAANNFSEWLNPHENENTDIVLIGHSMGGLLAAEVALLPAKSPNSESPFRHKILGTINYDTPFLGMHPGVIKSGINSLFRPDPNDPSPIKSEPEPETDPGRTCPIQALTARQNTGLPMIQHQDPNFNPAFHNDTRLPVRSGWKNASHFVFKHAKHLRTATQKLITSHMEFWACLSDFDGLKLRYSRIRILEEDSGDRRSGVFLDGRMPPRVRFVNYYTASTGKASSKPTSTQNSQAIVSRTEGTAYLPTNVTKNDEKGLLGPQQNATGPSNATSSQQISPDDDQLSDDESSLSDLSDLDTLDDTASVFSESSTAVASLEYETPKDFERHSSDLGDPLPLNPQPYLPTSPFTLDSSSHKASHNRKAAFRSAVRQHNTMIKHNFHALKAQQKAEYTRLIREARLSPVSHKAQIKAFVETHKAERAKFAEIAKAEWKVMYDQLKRDFVDAAKIDYKSQKALKRASEEKEKKPLDKEEKRQERLNRVSEKNQRKAERHAKKMERKLIKNTKLEYDFSTARVGERIHALSISGESNPSTSEEQHLDSSISTSTPSPVAAATASTGASPPFASSTTTLPPYPEHIPDTPLPPEKSSSMSTKPMTWEEHPDLRAHQKSYDTEKDNHKGNKFCLMAPKDAAGNRDPTWVRVHMKGVDEVGAHCGLFYPLGPNEEAKTDGWSERYAWMVGDVADRIERWIGEAMSERLIRGFSGEVSATPEASA